MSDLSTMEAIRAIRAKRLAESVERDVQELLRPWGDASPEPRPVPLYIQELERKSAIAQAKWAEQERAKQEQAGQAAREKLTPLETRVSKLLATIPDAVQKEGLSLASLRAQLRGRWRGNCHPGELGVALRKLGFERKRQWHGAAGFGALWYPIR